MNIKPKKSLGQHFLTDEYIANKIVESLITKPDEPILEIGAGTGVLTKYLLKKENELRIIEIDAKAILFLKKRFARLENKLIEGDVLKLDFNKYFTQPFSIIGNFPYHISSPLFFKILENREMVTQVVCMLQYEVAERISSSHGNKKYGILSVLLQTFYDIELLFTVPKIVFYPQPKIKSAIVRLLRNNTQSIGCDEKIFFSVVKTAFGQRRKTLKNSLKKMIGNFNVKNAVFTQRPEQLSVRDFIYLTILIEELRKS